MKVSLTGKVVLITGASRGLGRAISLEFARRGANLALAARSPDVLDQTRRLAERLGAEVIALRADVTSIEDVNALVRETVERYGRIDVLVNNAGIARVGEVGQPSFADDVGAIMSASLFGMVAVTQTVLPVFRRQGRGSLVNMSSIMGRKAFAKFRAYAIVMHAVSALSDALRQELRGSGVNVMTVYPALSESDLLRDVSPADMPPPFRYLTPLTAERVAREVADGVERGRTRVVTPRRANMLLLGDAVSSHIGDWIANALAQGWLARILFLSSGKTYHEAINTTPPAARHLRANPSVSPQTGKPSRHATSRRSSACQALPIKEHRSGSRTTGIATPPRTTGSLIGATDGSVSGFVAITKHRTANSCGENQWDGESASRHRSRPLWPSLKPWRQAPWVTRTIGSGPLGNG